MAGKKKKPAAKPLPPKFPALMDACKIFVAVLLTGYCSIRFLIWLSFVIMVQSVTLLLITVVLAYVAYCFITIVCRIEYCVYLLTVIGLGWFTVALLGAHPFWQASHWVFLLLCLLGSVLYRWTYEESGPNVGKSKRKRKHKKN